MKVHIQSSLNKYQLPFVLLSDPDHQCVRSIWRMGIEKMYGREYEGVFRTTFVIGPDGKIKHVFENVKPADHSQEVLEVVKA
jgi:thioredoxin-dependent peroxiredoxin